MSRILSTGPDGALVLLPTVTAGPTRGYSGDPCDGCGLLACVESGAGRTCARCGWTSPHLDPAMARRLPGPRL